MRIRTSKAPIILALVLLITTPEAVSAGTVQVESEPDAAIIDTLISVGENRLHFQIIEGRKPAILLESGGGYNLEQWMMLAPWLARETGAAIITYDRAGFGQSDLPEVPHDMRLEAGWLWNGLEQLGLDSDLVLVGHSFGGWMIRLEANEHPEAVRGMVFIDPFTTEFVDRLGVEYLDDHPMAGRLPFDTSDPASLTTLQRAQVRMVGDGLAPKIAIMRDTRIPEGIPVEVITCARQFLPKVEEHQAWHTAHEHLAESIPGAVLIPAENSNHLVPLFQPGLVVESVTRVYGRITESGK